MLAEMIEPMVCDGTRANVIRKAVDRAGREREREARYRCSTDLVYTFIVAAAIVCSILCSSAAGSTEGLACNAGVEQSHLNLDWVSRQSMTGIRRGCVYHPLSDSFIGYSVKEEEEEASLKLSLISTSSLPPYRKSQFRSGTMHKR